MREINQNIIAYIFNSALNMKIKEETLIKWRNIINNGVN